MTPRALGLRDLPTSNPLGSAPLVRDGYIDDYLTGEPVRATPEEVDAVQVFVRRLVEDYGYDKSQIQAHPQFRVRSRPSDEARSYPIDIAVFVDDRHTEDHLFMVVECKKSNRPEGLAQLKLYLDMSPADVGVWFNGNDHIYLRKIYRLQGRRTYEEIPNIPRLGQSFEDIGLYQRRDLKVPSNLKAVLKDLRHHLAGNVTGITRDEALAQQIINLLFCKIYDERHTRLSDVVTFRSGVNEPARAVRQRITALFDKVKAEYPDVFDSTDALALDERSLQYVVGELQPYAITKANRDAVGDAFEVFIGPALRGADGQFFTPRNVVAMMIDMLDPQPGETIIDPACGSGGFLIHALQRVWSTLESEAGEMAWEPSRVGTERLRIARDCFRGLDKDSFLAKVTKAYMAIVGDGRGGIFCQNSLEVPASWQGDAQERVKLETFDIVVTNPPFGKNIRIRDKAILEQYLLGHKWQRSRRTGKFELTSALQEHQPPQILFLERCLQLLKPGGRMGIVLPEAIFGMPRHGYVVTFLLERVRIRAVVSMPEALFKTSGKGGTHAKVVVVLIENSPPAVHDYEIFMAEARWCGHDSRGNPTVRKGANGLDEVLDDVPKIADRWRELFPKST